MKFFLLIILLFSCLISGYGRDQINEAFYQADSLFEAKKFTESFEIYQHLLEQERLTSPAMLLKMAFIKEGLGDYTNALYYLNLHHLQTADKGTLRKMEELAEKKGLQGYAFNDLDVIRSVYYNYFHLILLFLGALALMLVALMYYKKYKLGEVPTVTGIFVVSALALLFYVLNFSKDYDKGIITSSNTYIMNGPSAGAEVIDIVSKGHRIPLYGRKDVWASTEWRGKRAFVKADKIKAVTL